MKLLFAVLIVALSGRVISQDYDVAKMTVNTLLDANAFQVDP